MRYIQCGECMKRRTPGTRQVMARSKFGEPAEYERVVTGIAKQPQADQRYIAVNGVKQILSPDFYNCDTCDAEIRMGESCGAWTVWTEETGEIAPWEDEYLIIGGGA